MTLACPDCGNPLSLAVLTNGQHTAQCTNDCRAQWVTAGKTADQAADKFVQKCEAYGYTAALEEKLEGLNQEER